LKGTGRIVLIAGECSLWLLPIQNFHDLPIRHIAHLIVLLDNIAALITNATFALWHQCITYLIGFADIAIDTSPAFVTLAVLILSHGSVLAIA
jgi:uncharacterized membrane protein